MDKDGYRTLEILEEVVKKKLHHEESVKVSVHVRSKIDSCGEVSVGRMYNLEGKVYSQVGRIVYDADENTSKSDLIRDAFNNLQSCFDAKLYDSEVKGNVMKISPKQGISITERLFEG